MRALTTITTKLAILAVALVANIAMADPPGRAIRVASIGGPVSFLPSGETDWMQARVNRPLWTGDRLWTDRAARAELQIGGAVLFVGSETSVAVLDFDDDRAQFEVTQGTVEVYVRALGRNDAIEIDTPNLAFVVRSPGRYRIDVRPEGDSTAVAVLRGQGEAFGARAAYVLSAGQGYRFYGAELAEFEAEPVRRADAFASWVAARMQRYERSQSARYVSPDVIGYADLDAYGAWRNVAAYGPVWVPTRVETGWAPYRYGHWSWVEPWGWTWIDDAPWGFAPFHYGRWAHVDNRYWAWVPGPRNAAPVYAPALVAFVGGDNFRLSVSSGPGVAWFPLAPGEVYRPAYNASREYFTRVNVTNTVVNVTNVTNVYNNPRVDMRYVNVNNVNAVTAVPTQAFAQAQPVQRAAVRVDRNALRATEAVGAAPVAPTRESVRGAPPAQARPDQRVFERQVVARQAPPPAPPSIDRREETLKRQPGKPLDRAEVAKGAPPRPNVTVVQAAPAAQPIPAAPAGERGKGRDRDRDAPGQAKAPPPQVAQPAPPAPERSRGQQDERGRGNAARGQPEQPAARAPDGPRPSVAAPPPAMQPTAPQPQVAQPAPRERGKGNADRERPEQRPPPAAKAPEPARPSAAAPPPPAQQPAPPPQAAQPGPVERGRGNADRGRPEPPPPAARAPEPPAPQVAQPAPSERRGQPEQPQPAARPPESQRPSQAAPAPESASPPPQDKGQSRRNRDDDGGPPGQRGKGRD